MRSSGSDSNTSIGFGAVTTPLLWAEFAASEFGIFDRWIAGATVFDPTMGEGALLESLISLGVKADIAPHQLPLSSLYGVEIESTLCQRFVDRVKRLYGVDMPRSNFRHEDILFQSEPQTFDIVFGNPPWLNFTDLPGQYKARVKSKFVSYGLAGDPRALLLGGSRIDVSALVIQKTIQENLDLRGEAVFFIPLSLLLNDGANRFFRQYRVNGVEFYIDRVVDFGGQEVFPGVKTRYGLIHVCRDRKQRFPIRYKRWDRGQWNEVFARPLFGADGPLSVGSLAEFTKRPSFEPIEVDTKSTPRQGVNTCGANGVFFFDDCVEQVGGACVVRNGSGSAVLPRRYVHPLLISKNFGEAEPVPRKWVFLPYTSDGRPMSAADVTENAELHAYLERHRRTLLKRKGSLIGSWIRRGYWWAMMGVGPYSFAKHKIVWEAYGKKRFAPRLLPGEWQANQSLQAFIPCEDRGEAERILALLGDPWIERYLLSFRMEGTMNWAQPGRIKRLMKFHSESREPEVAATSSLW